MRETRSNLKVTVHKAYDWKKSTLRYWACKHILAKNSENARYFRIFYVLFSSLDQTNSIYAWWKGRIWKTLYNQSKTTHKLFSDVEIVIIYEKFREYSKFLHLYVHCLLLGLPYNRLINHKLLAVFITFLNLLKAVDSSDKTKSENYQPSPSPFFYSKSSHIKK